MTEAFSGFEVSGSGLNAQRLRMNIIAANIANANNMSAANGEPYRRRDVVLGTDFSRILETEAEGGSDLGAVEVSRIAVSKEPFDTMYDPAHPMADEKGFVKMPNVDVMREMVDMVSAQRGYDANLTALKTYRDMLRNSISMLRS